MTEEVLYALFRVWLMAQVKEHATFAVHSGLDVSDVDININALPYKYGKNRQSKKRCASLEDSCQKAV